MQQFFGSYINGVRNARKISIAALAMNTGMSENDLANLERGTICASKEMVVRLANYFGESETEFLKKNQASKVTSQKVVSPVNEHQIPFFKNSKKTAKKRIENIERDLNLLAIHPLTMKFHQTAAPVNQFIESIIYCQGHNLGHSFERTIPDGTAQLQIVIGEGGREMIGDRVQKVQVYRRAWLMGLNSAPITYRLSEVLGVIYVRFRPYGLYAFTKIVQAELNNLVVDAANIFGSSIENLWETLATLGDPARMISCVEDFFAARIHTTVPKPDLLAYLLNHPHVPLTQLAKKTGYSDKYLTKTLQKYVGVGPKVFQRIQRFQAAIGDMNRCTEYIDWPDLVFKHDYHDQAHFIKEFKHFTGFSPQNYLSMAPSCARYLHASNLQDNGMVRAQRS